MSETRTDLGSARGAAVRPDPSFLIVGTSRSGTTLVQRLAHELQGVRVPPETHFFGAFLFGLVQRERFPMNEAALRAELAVYAKMRTSRGLALDPDAIVDDLGGVCASPWALFGGIVRNLAGPSAIYGEKTPEHLRCWETLTRRVPDLRMICVVREPRAVVASNLQVPFAPHSVPWLAERWRTDQRIALAARDGLGPERFLLMPYEDVVRDPGAAVMQMSAFLGVPVGAAGAGASGPLHLGWEWWKERAAGAITTDRIDAWRSELTPRQARLVVSICRQTMARAGYPVEVGPVGALGRSLTIAPREQARRARFRAKIARYRSRVGRVAL